MIPKFDLTDYDFQRSFSFKRVLTERYYEGEPLEIGNEAQILIGNTLVEDAYRVYQTQEVPHLVDMPPVYQPDRPWETEARSSWVDVDGIIYDKEEKLYKAFYIIGGVLQSPELSDWEKNLPRGNCPGVLCYMESDDMINWRKPMFTHCPVGSYKESNIVFTGGTTGISGGRVFLNPKTDNKDHKYVVIYIEGNGPRVAVSPDGRHWQDYPGINPIIPVYYDTHMHVMYDATKEKYLLYLRPSVFAKEEHRPGEPDMPGTNYRRRITITESSDLIHWSTPRIAQMARETDYLDQCDNQNTFAVGGTLVARMGKFVVKTPDDAIHQKHKAFWTAGPDQYHMSFLDKDEPIPNCADDDGNPTDTMMMCVGYPMYSNDKTYFTLQRKIRDSVSGALKTVIGMCEYQENAFVARESDIYGGWLLTREFYLRGNEIEINCKIPEGGKITAEIVRGNGGRIRGGLKAEGFLVEECDPVTESGVHMKLSWNGSSDLSRFEDAPVFVRFHIENAKLFGFKVNKR